MFDRDVSSRNLRDGHIVDTLESLDLNEHWQVDEEPETYPFWM